MEKLISSRTIKKKRLSLFILKAEYLITAKAKRASCILKLLNCLKKEEENIVTTANSKIRPSVYFPNIINWAKSLSESENAHQKHTSWWFTRKT